MENNENYNLKNKIILISALWDSSPLMYISVNFEIYLPAWSDSVIKFWPLQSEAKRDESDDSEEDDGLDDRNEENKDANEGQKVSLDMIKGWRVGLEVLLFINLKLCFITIIIVHGMHCSVSTTQLKLSWKLFQNRKICFWLCSFLCFPFYPKFLRKNEMPCRKLIKWCMW